MRYLILKENSPKERYAAKSLKLSVSAVNKIINNDKNTKNAKNTL